MNEKDYYTIKLPYPTRPIEANEGILQEYIIPEDKKEEVFRQLYPFIPVPSLNARRLDAHENKRFKIREFRVFYDGAMNILASPFYPSSGGTVIDWM
ncbi:MAG: hypothetical protein K9N52_03450 [Verrucomicrobia bacterium]|nr:hypothetical protein [Verrucomicrobiota bacterium]